MIPLRDCLRPRSFPYVNLALILATLGVWVWQTTLSNRELIQLVQLYGAVPARISRSLFAQGDLGALLPLTTSIFLHGGWVHILGNMLYLWVFGDNVEDRLGHLRYLLFYLGAGIIGGLAQVYFNPGSTTPVVGASGAIAGVLGAYVLSYPRAQIETLLVLVFYITIVRIPAVVFIFFWFALQLLNGVASLGGGVAQTVAWWAHIGGFLGGMLLLLVLAARPAETDETGC
ncbi:MAG: rhomboid family intramembrane serine protease [Syntrophomonadaceae bacterium]|nr:rhomboid family intramembrane serine protease [Syntrophomonadaceae bacterium]